VLAHASCNSKESDRLVHADHLNAWVEHAERFAPNMAREFNRGGIVHDLPTSVRIVNWAYRHTFDCHGLGGTPSVERLQQCAPNAVIVRRWLRQQMTTPRRSVF